jgi:general secretion pathway protein C
MSRSASAILERGFTGIVLALCTVAAAFTARGVSGIAAATLAAAPADLAAAPLALPRALSVAPDDTPSAEAILARNPFDSATGSLLRHDPGPEGDADAVPIDPANAPRCDALVVHAIVATADEGASFASLSTEAEPHAVLRARGGTVGAKVVRFVGRDRVWLSDGAGYRGLCQVALFAPSTATAPAASAAPLPVTAPVRGGGAPLDPVIAKGIEQVSATERRIDRGVFEKILAEHAELTRGTGVAPIRENGNVVGLKVSGVRPDGLLATLGIENGDRLTSLNGFDVTDPEKALNAYAQLRVAPKIVVVVVRAGRPLQLDYVLR